MLELSDNLSMLKLLENADEQTALAALAALEVAFAGNTIARDALRRSRLLLQGTSGAGAPPVPALDRLSLMMFAPGTPSADGSAVLGHNGYIYLTEGSNYVLSRYQRENSSSQELASRWCDLFDERAARQAKAGRQYLQFIVPEKISSLPENLPFSLPTPTALLSLIEDRCKSSATSEGWKFISALTLFRDAGPQCVPRLDSHQSTYGTYLVAHEIAEMFGCDALANLPFTEVKVRSGDLALRFFGVPIYEALAEPDFINNPVLKESARLVEMYQPEKGNNGIRCIWQNPNALIKLRAVAFGNSCFERGGSPLLSWWFAHLFSEFHFIWSSTIDDDYAEAVKADLVIGQTMERFLFVNNVPET